MKRQGKRIKDVHFVAAVVVLIAICSLVLAQGLGIKRVSISKDRGEANGNNLFPAVSADGRFIAFESSANNLARVLQFQAPFAPFEDTREPVAQDPPPQTPIYVHDALTGRTESIDFADPPTSLSLSADGRFVAYIGFVIQPVIVIEFENGKKKVKKTVNVAIRRLVKLFDRELRVFQVLTPFDPTEDVFSDPVKATGRVSISADGRFTAFDLDAEVLVRDRLTGELGVVSVASDGTPANNDSFNPSISGNGRFVAFESLATNLVPGDTNSAMDIFVHDRDADADGIFDEAGEIATVRVSTASDGSQANAESFNPVISADGRFVAFESWATNLVSGDTNGARDIFVKNLQTGETVRVSVASGAVEADFDSGCPSISGDGRFTVFESIATNLVIGDSNGVTDIFLHDLQTRKTTRLSITADGKEGNFESVTPTISRDGRFVAFESLASNLVPVDTNGVRDIFLLPNPLAVVHPDIFLRPARLNFGRVPVGGTQSKNLTIFNRGGAELLVLKVTSSAPEFVVASPTTFPQSVPPKGKLLVTVQFASAAVGRKRAFLDISTNDPDDRIVRVPMVGVGR